MQVKVQVKKPIAKLAPPATGFGRRFDFCQPLQCLSKEKGILRDAFSCLVCHWCAKPLNAMIFSSVLCWIYLVKTIGIGTSEAIPNSMALKPEAEPCTYQMPPL